MYNEKVMNIFQNPEHMGDLKGANAVGQVGNMACGDIMKIYLKIENEKITDAKFKTFGCAAAISSSDVAMDLIKDKTVEQALKVTNKDVLAQLGELPAQKIHCSVLAQEAIHAAVEDYRKKQRKKAEKEGK